VLFVRNDANVDQEMLLSFHYFVRFWNFVKIITLALIELWCIERCFKFFPRLRIIKSRCLNFNSDLFILIK